MTSIINKDYLHKIIEQYFQVNDTLCSLEACVSGPFHSSPTATPRHSPPRMGRDPPPRRGAPRVTRPSGWPYIGREAKGLRSRGARERGGSRARPTGPFPFRRPPNASPPRNPYPTRRARSPSPAPWSPMPASAGQRREPYA